MSGFGEESQISVITKNQLLREMRSCLSTREQEVQNCAPQSNVRVWRLYERERRGHFGLSDMRIKSTCEDF